MKIKILIMVFIFATLNFAQSLSGVKICIDPGHGGHDPANDRFVPETGYWESDGNWEKGLLTKEILENLGAEVILTRQGNTDNDDLPLSTRAGIANSNNVDYFHSIHSNAYQGTSNYSLLLYKGTDSSPAFSQAKTMGGIMADKIYTAHRTTNKYVHGDVSFLGFYLGVLNPLNMPGTLSEGSFHDYIPESWRLMSSAYRKHEAWAIAEAFLSYFNAGNLQTGQVAGILRDVDQSVDYYYIPGTHDDKVALNYVSLTLEPSGRTFYGDDMNNGFYLFDDVPPGQYTLVYTAEDYSTDSLDISVSADHITFEDFYLSLTPNLNPPNVIDSAPADNSENVSLNTTITIDFDIRMNRDKTENAFSISPAAAGIISWSHNDKTLTFTPDNLLSPGTTYTIGISANAESIYGVNLPFGFASSFSTRSKLNLLSAYPQNGDFDVSSSVVITLQFDAPIYDGSLPGNVELLDENNVFPQIVVDYTQYSQGRIVFYNPDNFDNNMQYRLNLKSGVGDTEGLTLGTDTTIIFTTEPLNENQGIVFDDFESGQYSQPSENSLSFGIDEELSKFEISGRESFTGDNSGNLEFFFTGSDALCAVKNYSVYDLGTDGSKFFALQVFGDLSGNQLEYIFEDAVGNLTYLPIDTLNWTGWKFKSILLSQTGIAGENKFIGLAVRRLDSGGESGSIYFDDAQFQENVVSVENSEPGAVSDFRLEQNFPNPFNPSTQIRYGIPDKAFVQLIIYDLLGRKVAALINKEQTRGNYSVKFSGGNLPSGIYIYKLSAVGGKKKFSKAMKMILLK